MITKQTTPKPTTKQVGFDNKTVELLAVATIGSTNKRTNNKRLTQYN